MAARVGHEPFDRACVGGRFDGCPEAVAAYAVDDLMREVVGCADELCGWFVVLTGGRGEIPSVHQSVEYDETREGLPRHRTERCVERLVECAGCAHGVGELTEDRTEGRQQVTRRWVRRRGAAVG